MNVDFLSLVLLLYQRLKELKRNHFYSSKNGNDYLNNLLFTNYHFYIVPVKKTN